MDVFLGAQFTTYGIKVLEVTSQPFQNRDDPMSKIFPKVTFACVADDSKFSHPCCSVKNMLMLNANFI